MLATSKSTIVDVTKVVTKGTTPTTLGRQFASSGVGFIKAECISQDGALIAEKQMYIDAETDQLLKRSRLQKDDVLFSIAGVIGRTAIVRESALPANTNQAIAILRPDVTKILPRFLYYTVRARTFQDHSLGHVVQTAQANVSLGVLSAAPIWLPPLPIQRRIAGILSVYDDLIENSQRRIKILESMARAIYREWFVHFRFPGHENHPRVPSPLGEIPEGWSCVRLADLGEITVGGDWGRDSQEDGDWVEVGCLRGVDLHAFATAGFSEVPIRWIKRASLERRRVSPVDVLIEGSGECGRSLAGGDHLEALVGRPVVYSNFCKRVRLRDPASARYVEYVLNAMVKTGEMAQYKTGTTIPNLNMSALFETHYFLLPPSGLLSHFVGLLASSDKLKFSGRIQNLRRTRDLLLPRLLSGQIDLDDLEPV